MGDTVTTSVLQEDDYYYVAKFTNQSDGTGESAVTKIDVSALTPPAQKVDIKEITWSTHGVGVDILWDATANVLAWTVPANSSGHIDFTQSTGPLSNTQAAGWTGDVLFTVTGALASAGHGYTIILVCQKKL
ncbi:MAG: hypothetical protein JRF50_16005 [Deltaproteobacteria bacterium]|nr:hypothetical protein [Deltaproteobacteria bacterium]